MTANGERLMAWGIPVLRALAAAAVLFGVARRRPPPGDDGCPVGAGRILFDTADNGIVVMDAHGIIRAFNPAAEAIFGYKAAEAVGQDIGILMPEPDRDRHGDCLARYRRTGERHVIGIGREVVARRKDGSTVSIELLVSEWRHEGRSCFTGILRDISGRKAAEAALRAAKEEAERASLAKTRFLAAASHDLRQPFQAMRLLHHLLMARLAGAPERMIAARLGESLEAGERLLDALLDVSTLEAGVVRPKIGDVPLRDLLARLAREFEPEAAGKGLRLTVVPSAQVVRSDPVLLARMIRNLLANALRHAGRGRILLGCRRAGAGVRVEVWDTGPGIPADQLEAIFEDFHQLGNPEQNRALGLGLGLPIVRRTARLLDHPVSVRSKPGRGSVFAITVPRGMGDPDQGY